MIANTLIEASYYASQSIPTEKLYSNKAVKEAYVFIQGTGLEITIELYGLDYNAGKLREKFNRIFKSAT